MNERVLKRMLSAEVLGLVLVAAALQVLLSGVEVFLRGLQTDNLFWACLFAASLGLWAGKSRWTGVQTSAAMTALGVIGIWILGARLTLPLIDLIKSSLAISPQFFPEFQYRFDVDINNIYSSWNVISISSNALLDRWQTWLVGTTKDVNVNDALIRNMIWTLGLWLLSAWIGWFAAKQNAVASLLPGTVLLTIMMYNSERRVESLWALVIIMLLLMGIWNYRRLTQHWDTQRIDYSDSIRYDNSQAVIIVALVVGSIAFFTPSVSWRDIRDAWREIERQRAAQQSETTRRPDNSEVGEPQPPRPTVKPALPREHLLTAGYAQSETIVMTIKTGELPPVVIQNITTNAPRYYWRSTVYDQYVGAGWYSTSAPAQPVEPSQPLIPGVLSGYKLLHLNVQMQQPEGRLYWSGMLYSADIPLTVDWRLRPEPNLFADQSDLLQADMFAARSNASTYKVDTYVPIPSVEQLRGASGEYPQHIQDLYFSLPGTVPERVHRLAQDITKGKETSYDKARAIESYLRTNYPYDLEIDAPPEDRDVVDYFLFDLRRGYCDYYATAMVVLARSSGLPARFVSGYAPGEYDAPNAQYVIREKHAHSWAEIYFSEIGWVEFEPTGYQPEIIRGEAVPTAIEKDKSENATRRFLFELTSQRFSVFLFPTVIIAAMFILYFAVIERLLFLRLAPPVAIQILYRRLYRAGRPLAGERTRAETAYEFMNKLIQGIHTVHEELKFRHAPHKVKQDIERLTSIYQSSLFSNHDVDEHDVKMALKVWSHLRWSLFIERIKYFISRRTKIYRDRVNQ